MSLQDLKALVPPPLKPSRVPKKLDWNAVEKKLGLKLPRDYKLFVPMYGSGLFAGFIRIFNPFDRDPYMSLTTAGKTITEMYAGFKQREGDDVLPFPLYSEAGGLLPVGNDENGNYLFWVTSRAPSKWSIVVAEGRGSRWQQFDSPLTTFLVDILKRSVRCKIWPRDFPARKREFEFTPY